MRIPEISSYTQWYVLPTLAQASRMTPSSYQTNQLYGLANQLTLSALQPYSARNEGYRQQLVDFSTNTKNLASAAKPFSFTGTLFSAKTVQSASQAVTGTALNEAKPATYDVKVSQLAQGQKNSSLNLASAGLGALTPGDYRLGFTVNGQEKQLAFSVGTIDSNKTVLSKIASAVNTAFGSKSDSGIQAEVKTAGSYAYLSLTSSTTGKTSAFSVRDVVGNTVSALKLDSVVQSAQDSSYQVNGKTYSSDKNQVFVDNGKVTFNLQGTTTAPVKVKVAANVQEQVDAVQKLVSAYNTSRSQLAAADNLTAKGNHVFDVVEKVLSDQRSTLSNLGITVDRLSGQITVQEDRLTQALTNHPDSVKRLFTGSGGIAEKMGQAARTLMVQPTAAFFAPPGFLEPYGSAAGYSGLGNYVMNWAVTGLFMDQRV